jgi:hypothetical protein
MMALLLGVMSLVIVPLAAAAPPPAPGQKAPSEAGLSDLGKKDEKLPPNLGLSDHALGGLLWQSAAAVLVILVFGGAGLLFVKRLMPRIAVARGRRVLLLETFHLGPQRALHVVQVGSRSLLVGASRDGLSLLADVTRALPPPEIDLGAPRPRARFVLPPVAEGEKNAGKPGPRRRGPPGRPPADGTKIGSKAGVAENGP